MQIIQKGVNILFAFSVADDSSYTNLIMYIAYIWLRYVEESCFIATFVYSLEAMNSMKSVLLFTDRKSVV